MDPGADRVGSLWTRAPTGLPTCDLFWRLDPHPNQAKITPVHPSVASLPPKIEIGDKQDGTATYIEPVTGALLDEGSGSAYDDALYQPATLAHSVPDLAAVDAAALDFYAEQGYLSVDRAYSSQSVQAALQGLVDLVMGKNPAFKEVYFEAKAKDILPKLAPEQRLDYVRKLNEFVEYDARLKALAYQPELIKIVQTIVGSDDIVLSSDMALLKPPRLGREKPWHQDMAYYKFKPGTKVVGVWVALDEATVENGCMQMLPELFKRGAMLHFKRRDWQICDNEIMGRRSVAAPLKPGGLLFFDAMLPHGTPENRTLSRRRAVQFHYHAASAEKITDADRLKIYGTEGKNVTC